MCTLCPCRRIEAQEKECLFDEEVVGSAEEPGQNNTVAALSQVFYIFPLPLFGEGSETYVFLWFLVFFVCSYQWVNKYVFFACESAAKLRPCAARLGS